MPFLCHPLTDPYVVAGSFSYGYSVYRELVLIPGEQCGGGKDLHPGSHGVDKGWEKEDKYDTFNLIP